MALLSKLRNYLRKRFCKPIFGPGVKTEVDVRIPPTGSKPNLSCAHVDRPPTPPGKPEISVRSLIRVGDLSDTPFTMEEFEAGINWWETNWASELDFHCRMYITLDKSREDGNYNQKWWTIAIDGLWKWRAFRSPIPGIDKYKIQRRIGVRIDEFNELMSKISELRDGQVTFPEADYEDLSKLFLLAKKIKRSPSPVSASKICHFLAPEYYLVTDNRALGLPGGNDYESYYRYAQSCFRKSEPADILEMKERLKKRVSIRPIPLSDFPFNTKIAEICLIGRYQSRPYRLPALKAGKGTRATVPQKPVELPTLPKKTEPPKGITPRPTEKSSRTDQPPNETAGSNSEVDKIKIFEEIASAISDDERRKLLSNCIAHITPGQNSLNVRQVLCQIADRLDPSRMHADPRTKFLGELPSDPDEEWINERMDMYELNDSQKKIVLQCLEKAGRCVRNLTENGH